MKIHGVELLSSTLKEKPTLVMDWVPEIRFLGRYPESAEKWVQGKFIKTFLS